MVVSVPAEHEDYPRPGPNAPESDDLVREVHVPVALEQAAQLAAERAPIGPKELTNALVDDLRSPNPYSSIRSAETALPGGDREARGKALHVPLPWSGQRHIEVVEVEQKAPRGSREAAEVRQVGIAAELDRDSGLRAAREVRRHHVAAPRKNANGEAAMRP